jgi:nucleoside-triphosphatase THEP1
LYSDVEDKSKELAELTKLLNEKNKVIAELRKSNKAPYVSEKITNSSRVISCNEEKKKPTKDDYSFWDRILTIFFDKR